MELGNFQSIVAYVSVTCICMVLAISAERLHSSKLTIALAVILILFAGMRTSDVGLDNSLYFNNHYWNTLYFGADVTSKWYDTYYVYIMEMTSQIGSWNLFTLIISACTYSLIVFRFWELRQFGSFAAYMCVFLCLYYPLSLNISRQFLAIAIVFFGTRYFFVGRYLKFLASILVAFLVHRISMMGLGFFLLLPLQFGKLSWSKRTVVSMLGLFAPIVAIAVSAYLFTNYAGYYLSNIHFDLGIAGILKISYLLLVRLLSGGEDNKGGLQNNRSNEEQPMQFYYIALLGIAISFIGYFFANIDRIALFYLMYEPVIYGQLLQKGNATVRRLTSIFIMILCAYSLLSTLLVDSQGIVPYAFCLPGQLFD